MALQSQRAMLDALMGNERNELPNAPKSRIKWNDRDVCPYFLCGFCPHALFPSTKNDLGPCSYHHHEDYLRDAFQKESPSVQYKYETKFLVYLQDILSSLERRMVHHNRSRTDLTDGKDKEAEDRRKKNADDLLKVNEHIQNLKKQILDLISAKKNTEAASLTVMMESLEKEQAEKLKQVEKDVSEIAASGTNAGNKKVSMCDVCGSFLVQGDTAERLVGHYEGKQHSGFLLIRNTVTDLVKKHAEYRSNNKSGSRSPKRRSPSPRRRSRSPRRRSRSPRRRSRSPRRRSRSPRRRSRSRERRHR